MEIDSLLHVIGHHLRRVNPYWKWVGEGEIRLIQEVSKGPQVLPFFLILLMFKGNIKATACLVMRHHLNPFISLNQLYKGALSGIRGHCSYKRGVFFWGGGGLEKSVSKCSTHLVISLNAESDLVNLRKVEFSISSYV